MSTSTQRLSVRVVLAMPAFAGAIVLIVMSARHGLVGAFIGGIPLVWGIVASITGPWLFRRGGWLLAAVAILASIVLCFVSLFFYFRGWDL